MASVPPSAAAAPDEQSKQPENIGSLKRDRDNEDDSGRSRKKPKHNNGKPGRGGGRSGGSSGGDSRDLWRRDHCDKLQRGGRGGRGGRNAERAVVVAEGGGSVTAARPFTGPSNMRIPFSAEEIAAEPRRPKRKVAVLLGYAGTGYHGMQINHDDKTIEGDLFAAFVKAGAIAKANADDPKKSSLVRCARTDKGVHAAGNVISLKLILDGEEAAAIESGATAAIEGATAAIEGATATTEGAMVTTEGAKATIEGAVAVTAANDVTATAAATAARINAHLPPQIRIWGIHRTLNSFNCYQACDSRWYEYLLPSYALLPPHPDSFLGREMMAYALKADAHPDAQLDAKPYEAAGDGAGDSTEDGAENHEAKRMYEDMLERLADVQDFWPTVEREVVQPLLAVLDPDVRRDVQAQLHTIAGDGEGKTVGRRALEALEAVPAAEEDEKAVVLVEEKTAPAAEEDEKAVVLVEEKTAPAAEEDEKAVVLAEEKTEEGGMSDHRQAVEQALRDIKTAYVAAKRRYRVTPARLGRLQAALAQYEGTHNFHNYTVQKAFHDASAKRHIKSFVVNPAPIQIRNTEWLSLRVHGQSFMMHQIRKMVAMAVMVVRCGTAPARAMPLSYGPRRISIPKAPGFGLLLERPVFDTYNLRAAQAPAPAGGDTADPKAALDFAPYEAAMRAFKDREIYARIWDVEEAQNVFHAFFHQLDHFRTSYYLWAIPGGFDAAFERFGGRPGGGAGGSGQREPAPLPALMPDVDSDDEGANANEHEG